MSLEAYAGVPAIPLGRVPEQVRTILAARPAWKNPANLAERNGFQYRMFRMIAIFADVQDAPEPILADLLHEVGQSYAEVIEQ